MTDHRTSASATCTRLNSRSTRARAITHAMLTESATSSRYVLLMLACGILAPAGLAAIVHFTAIAARAYLAP